MNRDIAIHMFLISIGYESGCNFKPYEIAYMVPYGYDELFCIIGHKGCCSE